MFSLLGDIKLWSFECDINIQDTDFGTFRYHEKRSDNIYNVSKRAYSEERGMLHTLHNRKGNKLKEKIKYLEEQLRSNSIVYCRWFNQYVVQLVFNTGLLCYIQVNLFTGDIDKLTFDRFLVGKVPDTISDAAITSNHIICVQNDNQIIIVHFAKPKSQIFDKISKLDPKLLTLDLPSPSSRRSEKKIRVNRSGDLILIWWKSTINEVYPWSPAMKEHDHANVHLYRLLGSKFELLCYLRTEFDPLCIKFNTQQDNSIHSIEQKVSRKGEVTIEWQIYGISPQDKLQRIEVISIPLPTHTTCAKFSPNQDMLLLCCIDGSIIIHDHIKRTNNVLKAGFIPTLASWHNHGLIFTIGNDRGQAQHYDISSSCIKSQLLNEDAMPTNTLDLSSYFRNQPNLIKMAWNKKKGDINLCNGRLNDRDALLLILFERGPIGVMRIVEGNNLSGDTLVFRYLNLQLPDRATSLLLSMNWDLQPRTCMYALSQIVNYLFKLPLCPEHENLIQNALSSFYVPVQSISQTVEDEYSNEVRDLTRKFFYHLIRHRLFEKAFRLAIDLNDHDLFMDIHFYAVAINDVKMATMSEERAQLILNRSDSCSSSHSFCSRPSCSLCSHSGSDNRSQSCSEESDNENSFHRRLKYKFNQNGLNHKQLGSVTDQTPPLPVFNPPGIPKLRISSFGNPTNYTLSTIPTKLSSESSPFMNISKDFISSSFDNMPMNKLSMHERASNKIENEKSFHEESRNTPKHSEVTYTLSEGINSLDPSMSMKYSLTNIDINGRNITSDKHSTNNDPLRLIVHDSRHSELRYDPTCNNAVTNTDMESRLLSTSFNDVMCKTSFNNDDHLMSTSFNDEGSSESLEIHTTHQKTSFFNQFESDFEETFESNAYCDTTIEVPPPPPAMTSSLANYLNSLPKKKSPLSASTSGSNNRIDKAMTTFPGTHSMKHSSSQILQTQSSVSKILQNQCINNCSIMRTCKFNYDLDCIQYSCGCENDNVDRSLDGKQSVYSDALKHFQNNYNQQCKPVDSVLVKPNIFQSNKGSSGVADSIITSNVPPLPVINGTNSKPSSKYQGSTDGLTNFNEKPKVKFSNTVTHILVPEMDQPYQPIQKQKIIQLQMMNSEREVTDNLLSRDSRKNDDFLKDVHSIAKMEKPNETRRTEESSTIKIFYENYSESSPKTKLGYGIASDKSVRHSQNLCCYTISHNESLTQLLILEKYK